MDVPSFGTNGIREIVGERLSAGMVERIVSGIASALPSKSEVVVGWDGRTSSPAFSRIVSGAFSLGGHQVTELGVLPTPAVQYNVLKLAADLGVVVTASHNPPEYNGIKCIGSDGLEVPREFEEEIERRARNGDSRPVPFDRVGEIHSRPDGAWRYLEGILDSVDRELIRARRFTVVLDCGNGASVVTSPGLLRELGCRVVTLNGHLDGTFPGRPSEPTEEHLRDLRVAVLSVGADFGVAHDGDADRAIFVDREGRFIPGERTFTLFAQDEVERHHGGIVVTPVSASESVEAAVKPLGGEVVYTRVGSPAVTREMQRRKAIFGGEENGGQIFPRFQLARDGAMTVAALLELLARKNTGLSEALEALPRFTMVKEKLACPVERRPAVVERVAQALEGSGGRLVRIDGVKAFLNDGWILVRPSGTEALLRVFAESSDPGKARALAEEGVRLVREALAGSDKADP